MDAVARARSQGWLAEQPQDFQEALLSRCAVKHFAKNEAVCRVGDPYDGVYALVEGVLRLELAMPDDFRVAATKQPVCWFGQAACLRKKSFLVSLTANTPVTLLFLPYHEFERLIENAAYCKSFALLTVDHYDEAIQALAPLLVSDAQSKVAGRLAQLAIQAGPQRPAVLHVAQTDLAEMCGLARVTVFGVLAQLEKRGLIETGYRRITVFDPEALVGMRPHPQAAGVSGSSPAA